MNVDYSDDESENAMMVSGGLPSTSCPVCSEPYNPSECASCRAIRDSIRQSRQALQRAETELRSQPGEADVFITGVGHFWGLSQTREYMRARFAAADALLKVNTKHAVETALDHFTDMLRLCRSDNMGLRGIIPHLLLRLDREQECYDFLKWWAVVRKTNRYDFGDLTLPYLDIRGADAFESVDVFCSGSLELSHLVALALLKLRLYLDLSAYEDEDDLGIPCCNPHQDVDRPIGRLVREKMQRGGQRGYWNRVQAVNGQYHRLFRAVHDANPYFWEILVTEETTSPPPTFSPGSKEEADLVLHQCRRAWQESEDAILMADAETGEFTTVYEGTPSAIGANNTSHENSRVNTEVWERKRGTGTAFPSKFKATASPNELFPPTITDQNQTVRFISRNDQQRILVYVDGACANNGQSEPRAGWAVTFATPHNRQGKESFGVSGRLENKGPFGDHSVATSNRAELRAVIGALRLCDWKAEGYNILVIATDASYVVDGATAWVKGWVRNGWKTRIGDNVKNKDLWELLLGEVERWKQRGLRVELWKIPREQNGEADAAAKNGASSGATQTEFKDICIRSSQPAASSIQRSNRVLALCIEYESLFDDCFKSLVSQITAKTKMERATTPDAAIVALTQDPPPSVILICDAAIARNKKLWECVIDRLREGATVVLAGVFSSMVNMGEFNRIFAKLGLPWKRGSYHRADISLRRSAVDVRLASHLPSECSLKALFVQNIEASEAWYTESEASNEAAVAFAKVGRGRLGYVGDVNGEEASNLAVLAMCGLLD